MCFVCFVLLKPANSHRRAAVAAAAEVAARDDTATAAGCNDDDAANPPTPRAAAHAPAAPAAFQRTGCRIVREPKSKIFSFFRQDLLVNFLRAPISEVQTNINRGCQRCSARLERGKVRESAQSMRGSA